MKKWIKEQKVNLILCLIILIGIGLISYPSVADWWNSFHQSRAIASYAAAVSQLNTEDYDKLFEEAEDYNRKLSMTGIKWSLTEEEIQEYNSILDISDTGIMGYIDIPKIRQTLPIYHGTDDAVLQIAIGHLVGTSFRWEVTLPTVSFRATGDFPQPGCLQIWTNSKRATLSQ